MHDLMHTTSEVFSTVLFQLIKFDIDGQKYIQIMNDIHKIGSISPWEIFCCLLFSWKQCCLNDTELTAFSTMNETIKWAALICF